MCGSLLFGAFLMLLGISIFVNIFFNIHIPVFRVLFGCMLLYLGYSIIMTPKYSRSFYTCYGNGCDNKVNAGHWASYANWMGKANVTIDTTTAHQAKTYDYSNTMGELSLNLTVLSPANVTEPITIDCNTLFGRTVIKLNKDMPVVIHARGSFGQVNFPDTNQTTNTERTYVSHDASVAPLIILTSHTTFGQTDITAH